MKNGSYKIKFISILIFLFVLATIILYNFLSTITSSNVGTIAKKEFKNKALEREEFIDGFFTPYTNTIKALKDDKNFIEFISNDIEKIFVQNNFLTIKKSLPCIIQVKYLDNQGREIIKIDGTPIGTFKDKSTSYIVSDKNLGNKYNTKYFKKFILLKKDELGISDIDLNKKDGNFIIPRQPTIKLAMAVYDKDGVKKGIILLNICLRTFFKQLNKTVLYHVNLIDNKGKYLSNHNQNKDILLAKNLEYSIKDEFPIIWKNILSNDEYYGKNIFSFKISNIKNDQNIKAIMSLKHNKVITNSANKEKELILYFILFVIVAIAIILYFSNLPDKLKEELIKNKLTNSLTKLPNRIALMEDLLEEKFQNTIIILISINNLIKIQNSYGEKISDVLVKEVAEFIAKYEDNNIEKVYVNNYNLFSIRYKFKDEESLKIFLEEFLFNIENKIFKNKRKSLEFTLDVTLGVSDPKNINNSLSELNEAENALEFALNEHIHIGIFNKDYNINIENNKENIFLAKAIKKAIDTNCIFLHYQPIYNNNTKQIEKYESLIRMKIDDEIIFPDRFLPISREIKKYNQLSKIVVNKSFEFFNDKKEFEFSINISVIDILNKEFLEHLINQIEKYNIGSRLVLEIVEQDSIENFDKFYTFIKKIKSYGCKIAIDDFGSGYSNFDYIIKMSDFIDYVKIDGSLIKNILEDEKTRIMIQSIIYLCSKLHIKTIAEYVESEEIKNYLSKHGVDYSQGYYIGKPKDEIK